MPIQSNVVEKRISRTMSAGIGLAVVMGALLEVVRVVEGVCVRECS
jgi:hypothetical protein